MDIETVEYICENLEVAHANSKMHEELNFVTYLIDMAILELSLKIAKLDDEELEKLLLADTKIIKKIDLFT